MSKSGLSDKAKAKFEKKFEGYIQGENPEKAFAKFLAGKPNDAEMGVFMEVLSEYAYEAGDAKLGQNIASATSPKENKKAGDFLLDYAKRHEAEVREKNGEAMGENDPLDGYFAREYLRNETTSRSGEKQQVRNDSIHAAFESGSIQKIMDLKPGAKELDSQDLRILARDAAYQQGEKGGLPLMLLFSRNAATIDNVFGGSFLQQPEPPEVTKPGAGQKELEEYAAKYKGYEASLAELEIRKGFAEAFLEDTKICSPDVAKLIAHNGASPSAALGAAVNDGFAGGKPTQSMIELLAMGAQPSIALENTLAQDHINMHAVNYLLAEGEFNSAGASASIEAAAKSGDADILGTLVENFKEKGLLEWKAELRAYATMNDKLPQALELIETNKENPDFIQSVNSDAISGPFAKLVKNVAINGDAEQLKYVKETIIDRLPEGEMRDLLSGELIIGYARQGNVEKITELADKIGEHIKSQDGRKAAQEGHINNLSSASLFAAVKAEQQGAVELLIEYGANINALVAETNDFPLKAAHGNGNKEIFNLLADKGALVRKSRGNEEVTGKLEEYYLTHPEAKQAAEEAKPKLEQQPIIVPFIGQADIPVIAQPEKNGALKARIKEAVGTHQTDESIGAVVDYTVRAVRKMNKEDELHLSREERNELVEEMLAKAYSEFDEANNPLIRHEGKDKTGHIHRSGHWKTHIQESIDLDEKRKEVFLDEALATLAEEFKPNLNIIVDENQLFLEEAAVHEILARGVGAALDEARLHTPLDTSMINSDEAFEEFIELVELKLNESCLELNEMNAKNSALEVLAGLQPAIEKNKMDLASFNPSTDGDAYATIVDSSDDELANSPEKKSSPSSPSLQDPSELSSSPISAPSSGSPLTTHHERRENPDRMLNLRSQRVSKRETIGQEAFSKRASMFGPLTPRFKMQPASLEELSSSSPDSDKQSFVERAGGKKKENESHLQQQERNSESSSKDSDLTPG